MRKYPPEIVRQKMVAWCNKAERCQWDIRNKLIEWLIPASERESLIAEFISNNLINEARYASAFTNDKSRFNQWGSKKIKMHLKQKGISEFNIKTAIQQIDQTEERKTILALIKKKESKLQGLKEYERRGKLYRFLLSKGFDMQVISAVLGEL